MFYLHGFDNIPARIRDDYDRVFYYRWCNEAFTALADHCDCTKDFDSAEFAVASATLRCVSFASVDESAMTINVAALAARRPYKRIVVFDLTDLPYPNYPGDRMIVCKSAYHQQYYSAAGSVAIPQFPRYQFDDTGLPLASERRYLAGFKGDLRPQASVLRTRLLPLNNDEDIIIKGGKLTPNHVAFLPTGRATENTPDGEWSYVDMLRDSVFALLPRACGYALSYRMIEAMNLGCVPVIISDGYVLPFSEVLDYDRFSIRIPEADIMHIPDILRERRPHADRLQAESLRVYREYFSSTKRIIAHTLKIAVRLQ